MKQNFLLLLTCIFVYACNGSGQTRTATAQTGNNQAEDKPLKSGDGDISQSPAERPSSAGSDADVSNGVLVEEQGGLDVARAYLSYEGGSLVPKTNLVGLGQTVYLNLIIDKGWEVQNGTVSLDASERIETADGRLVLNAPNLFKEMPLVKEDDATHLVLKAVITRTTPDIEHFVVNYHVWDKQGTGEAKGNYKLYVDSKAQ